MYRRILMMIALLLVLAGTSSAQEVDFCFNLAPEDCADIGAASAYTLDNLGSFQAAFTLDFSLTGLAELGLGDDTVLYIAGTGIIQRDDLTRLMPSEFSLAMAGTLTAGDTILDGTINLMMTSEALYIQTNEGEWLGINFEDLLNSPQFAVLGLFANQPNAMTLPTTGGFNDLASLLAIPGFVDYQRLSDDSELAPFSFSLDFVPLFASIEFQQLLDQVLKFAGQLDPSIESTALIAPLLLENSDLKINLTQSVGEDNFIHKLTLDVMGIVDLNPLLGTSGDSGLPPVALDVAFMVELSEINLEHTITAPADVRFISLDELQ